MFTLDVLISEQPSSPAHTARAEGLLLFESVLRHTDHRELPEEERKQIFANPTVLEKLLGRDFTNNPGSESNRPGYINHRSINSLHEGVRFIEHGVEPDPKAENKSARMLARALRKLGYEVAITPINLATPENGVQM
jgi:hypothetical protein